MTRPFEHVFNWPNILTFARILVVPLFVVIFYLPFPWAHPTATALFAIASLTDWLDGYLARYLRQTTKLGAFLDPVADKVMVSVALVMIVGEPTFQFVSTTSTVVSIPSAVITIPAAIIVVRELIVSALREWMAGVGKRKSVAVSSLGKIKTTVQMMAIVILLYCDNTSNAYLVYTGYFLLYAAAVLTIWSMCIYLKAARAQLLAD
jgi:CDP-diacylglycerol---glycerol-3-phosphate 3-phosphatidyltransferase